MKPALEINEPGLVLRLDGYLYIDTCLWTTQAVLTKKLKVSRNTINNRVRRGLANGTIRSYYIKQIGVRLIPNVRNISDLCDFEKKQ